MSDLSTIASLATAGGTLVLAVATFSSTRAANQAARVSERALQAGLRPVLFNARPLWSCATTRHWNLDRPDPR